MGHEVFYFSCALMLAAVTLPAQNTYPAGDVEDGRKVYLENCAMCHGPDGDSVSGIDFGHGKFRRVSVDDDIVQILKNGIPGTAMPDFSEDLSKMNVRTVIAYVRSMASSAQSTSAPGDAVRGKALFEGKGQCLSCHRVRDTGSRVGPDLSEIGSVRRLVELERSIVDPDAEILVQNRSIRVVTREGETITGRLLNQDSFTVQLIDSKERLLSLNKSSLKEFTFLDKSPMPFYRTQLNAQELADFVSYLVSLKGPGIQ